MPSPDTACVRAPASKSISHRYCIGAALAHGTSELHHVLDSRDLECTRAILCAAGARMEALPGEEGGWRVTGMDGRPRGGTDTPLSCDVHESGTTCRLLTAVLAAGHGLFRIHGAPRMHERPIDELTRALEALGTDVRFEQRPDCPPLLLRAAGLDPARNGGRVRLGMDASSQYFSGLLLAAPLAPAPLCVELGGQKAVSWPYVGLTLHCLEDFGIRFRVETREPDGPWQVLPDGGWRALRTARPDGLRITVQPGTYRAGSYQVEGDWSGASYLLAAGALGKRPVRVDGLRADSLQGDRAMLDILRAMGARAEVEVTSITVHPSALRGVDVDMGHCPDLVPTVAVLAAFAQGPTRVRNVAHLRIKESDRITAPATELARLGVRVDEHDDGLTIHGLGPDGPAWDEAARFSAHNDHRIAMSLALLGLPHGKRMDALLDDPLVVRKSFPTFWKVWEPLL